MEDRATRRILSGPLPWEVFRFGAPLALGMAMQTTFNLVDAYLIAHLDAKDVGAAVGALGICDQLAALGTIISYGISTATSALLAKHQGAGDTRSLQSIAWQSLLLVLGISIAFGAIGMLGAGFIVREVIGAKGDVATVATSYLRVIIGGSFSIFFLLHMTTMQRALGSSKTPAALLVTGNALNVVLAIVMIYGPGPSPSVFAWGGSIARALGIPRMGMLGAAWATIIARSIVLIPIAWILIRRFGIVIPKQGERGIRMQEIRRILNIAWPSSTQFVLRIAAMLLVNSLVARWFTSAQDQTATTAMGLVFRLDTMALFVAMGWGSAAQTFVGQNFGAKKDARAKKSGWLTALYDGGTNVALCAVIFVWGASILRVFDDDPAPVAIAIDYLRIVAPSYLGLGVGIALGNAMAGAGATRATLKVDALVILGLQFPLCIATVAVFGGSLRALFTMVAVANAMSAVAYCIAYTRGGWLKEARALHE